MSIENLMSVSSKSPISQKMMIFIYEIICLGDYTDQDIESLKDYEGTDNPHASELVEGVIKACKIFKTKCMLLKHQLPPATDVQIIAEKDYLNNKINIQIVATTFNSI
jgi:hypothetical protein